MKEIKQNHEVILATRNGAQYIGKQLDSIINQSARILIHDDGSSDETVEIIKEYAEKYENIDMIDYPPTGSAKNNFSFLMTKTESDYVFFADQDDIWSESKIEYMLEKIRYHESIHGKDFPLLLHTDLAVIDMDGKTISSSLWKYQNLDPRWGDKINLILTQNVVTGCAMVVNRALIKKALPVPDEAIMHDWWLALVACSFGKIIYFREPTVFYRQHGSNQVGAKDFSFNYVLSRFLKKNEVMANVSEVYEQAKKYSEVYSYHSSSRIARKFYLINAQPRYKRIYHKVINGFYKIGILRNIGWLGL